MDENNKSSEGHKESEPLEEIGEEDIPPELLEEDQGFVEGEGEDETLFG